MKSRSLLMTNVYLSQRLRVNGKKNNVKKSPI